jgi:hypothetical protein
LVAQVGYGKSYRRKPQGTKKQNIFLNKHKGINILVHAQKSAGSLPQSIAT